MNKKIIILLVLLSGALWAGSNTGPYIDFGYGASNYGDSNYYKQIKSTNVGAYNVSLGAYINRYLAVEIEYFKTGTFNTKQIDNTSSSFSYAAVTVNTAAHYYVYKNRIDLHVKFGMGQAYTNLSSSNGSAILYGLGASYIFSPRYSLGLNYTIDTFSYNSKQRGHFSMNMQYLSMDVKIKF